MPLPMKPAINKSYIDVRFLLGDLSAFEVYMPTFWNALSVPSMKMEQTECSETLTFKLQTPVNHPEESI
jgi:hypothetical protein